MSEPLPPKAVMIQMALGFVTAKAINSAAKLNIADLIASNGPLPIEKLSELSGADQESLYRLLRALASVGIFKEDTDGKYHLTPLAECLVENAPNSIKTISLGTGDTFYKAYEALPESVVTGEPGFQKAIGMPIFEYLNRHPEEGQRFDHMMTEFHGGETQPMVDNYDFSVFKTVVDVGGGNGSVLSAVLKKYPSVKGILYDLPDVVVRSHESIIQAGLEDRCKVLGGSFFDEVPTGGDAYILRHIIHDWSDEDAATILGNCRKAMNPGGKVLVVEAVIPIDNMPHSFKWLDLTMLMIGGKERTAEQFKQLFEKAGLRLEKIVPFMPELSVVEGVVA